MVDPHTDRGRVTRRAFVAGTLAAATTAACTSGPAKSAAPTTTGAAASTTAATSPPPPGVAAFVAHGPRDRPQVALTFHLSGDRALVDQLLTTLSAHQTVATAFVVGRWLDANPDVARTLRQDGHELANHTYTHPTFHRLAPPAMATEITRCRDTLERLAHTPGDYFRLSGTSNGTDPPIETALRAAADAGYTTVVGFDVDPADYADPGRALIVSRTAAAVQPGSIVSLHFGHQGTIDALPEILATLRSRGLRAVTTATLLAA